LFVYVLIEHNGFVHTVHSISYSQYFCPVPSWKWFYSHTKAQMLNTL